MPTRMSVLPLVLTGWVAACSSGESTGLSEAGARSMAVKPLELRAAQEAADGVAAADWMTEVGLLAPLLVVPERATAGAVLARPDRDTGALARVGSCACDAAGCRFQACAMDSGSAPLSGTIARSGDSFAFDLTMEIAGAGTDRYAGTLVIAPTLVDGVLTGSRTGGPYDASWRIAWRAVAVAPAGCAAGGALEVEVANAVGQPGGYEGTHELAFSSSAACP